MRESEKLKVNSEKYATANGITLIALIITIIVMLILVAVSISIALNTGLFESAGKATKDWKTTQDAEAELGNGKVNIGGTIYNSIDEYIATIGNDGTGGDTLPTVTAGQRATCNSKYSDGTKTAVIPKGFTVSGVKNDTVDETTIDGGLVIYLIPEGTTVDWTDGTAVANAQKTYDQFVWIPIARENINDMYMCQSEDGTKSCKITVKEVEGEKVAYCNTHSSTQMAGRLYATDNGEKFDASLTTQTYKANEGLREPDTVSTYDGNSTYLGYLSSILESDVADENKEYTSIYNFKEKLQEEYNEVVKSVYENQGFYVGRYETSNMTTTDGNTVKVVAGTTSGINKIRWYYMYAQQKDYAENKGLTVGSTMIQGAAYDQVMKFVDTEDYDVTTVGNVEHSFSSIYNTGSQSTDQSKNIFDLEGNVRAWTTEADYINGRVCRGGYYSGSTSASSRYFSDPGYSYFTSIGSLAQLYVK